MTAAISLVGVGKRYVQRTDAPSLLGRTREALEMGPCLTGPFDGTGETVSVSRGAQVTEGAVLVKLAAA